MTEDPHSPTTAGPTPEPATAVSTGVATAMQPAPTPAAEPPAAQPGDRGRAAAVQQKAQDVQAQVQVQVAEKPEILVGAAFAGGVLAAFILKRLGG
jgi:hypothetical protein